MSRSIFDLCESVRPLAQQLLREAHEKFGWSMVVVDTLRTAEEQRQNILNKVSWKTRSDHLPQPGCGKSHAIDIAPAHLMTLKNWAPDHPDWDKLGGLGESLGLLWGGRWAKRDCPHLYRKITHKLQNIAAVQSDVTMEHFG